METCWLSSECHEWCWALSLGWKNKWPRYELSCVNFSKFQEIWNSRGRIEWKKYPPFSFSLKLFFNICSGTSARAVKRHFTPVRRPFCRETKGGKTKSNASRPQGRYTAILNPMIHRLRDFSYIQPYAILAVGRGGAGQIVANNPIENLVIRMAAILDGLNTSAGDVGRRRAQFYCETHWRGYVKHTC